MVPYATVSLMKLWKTRIIVDSNPTLPPHCHLFNTDISRKNIANYYLLYISNCVHKEDAEIQSPGIVPKKIKTEKTKNKTIATKQTKPLSIVLAFTIKFETAQSYLRRKSLPNTTQIRLA